MDTHPAPTTSLRGDILASFVASSIGWLAGALALPLVYAREFDPIGFGFPWAGMAVALGWILLVLPMVLVLRTVGWQPAWYLSGCLGAVLGLLVYCGLDALMFSQAISSNVPTVSTFWDRMTSPEGRWISAWAIGGGAVAGASYPATRRLSVRRLLGIAVVPLAGLTWVVWVTFR